MRRVLPLLALCVLLSGCSVNGPGDGAAFWAISSDDDAGAYIWKPLANVAVGTLYAVYIAARVVVEACARCGGCSGGVR